jgi:hypothetical protein
MYIILGPHNTTRPQNVRNKIWNDQVSHPKRTDTSFITLSAFMNDHHVFTLTFIAAICPPGLWAL